MFNVAAVNLAGVESIHELYDDHVIMARTDALEPADGEVLAPSRPIATCPVVKTSVIWPYPIDAHLNELADELSRTALGEVTRSQILAAIVAHMGSDQASLAEVVARYRTSTVGSVTGSRRSIVIQPRTPGRRPRNAT